MNKANLINQTSGETDFWTPPFIVEAARSLMGGIDLDPATSVEANQKNVKAAAFYTKKANGLSLSWGSTDKPLRVWMNHPFSAGWTACDENCKRKTCQKRGHVYEDIPSNADWINKLVDEVAARRVVEACCITFASTSEAWFKPLLYHPQCFLTPRTNYYLPNGELYPGVTKGSVVTYFGTRPKRFKEFFESHGICKVRL